MFVSTSNAQDEASLVVSLNCILSEPYDQKLCVVITGEGGHSSSCSATWMKTKDGRLMVQKA